MEETKQCTLCGEEAKLKSGVSKTTGKPWKGYFCEADKKHVEWVRENNVPAGMKPYKPMALKKDDEYFAQLRKEKNENINHLNARTAAVEIVLKMYEKGDIIAEDIDVQIDIWIGKLEEK